MSTKLINHDLQSKNKTHLGNPGKIWNYKNDDKYFKNKLTGIYNQINFIFIERKALTFFTF